MKVGCRTFWRLLQWGVLGILPQIRYNQEFYYADPGSVLEVFVEDLPVFHAYSHDKTGNGLTQIPWIDITEVAGKKLHLTFSFSNPIPDTQGALIIDDLIFARIENQKNFDFNGDTFVDIQDAGLILKLITEQDLPGPLTGPNMTPIGQQELIHILQKSANKR